MFEAEAAGLQALLDTHAIRTAVPLCSGQIGDQAYLVTEYIELGRPSENSHELAGRQLALLHSATATQFGWQLDNHIGATPQPNGWRDNWIDFWREQRLGYQLELAACNGYGGRLQMLGEQMLDQFPTLIDHAPQPSLIHGDLWGGNMSFDSTGQPVIYDPATYYGDREAEIAMTELFGGFSGDFYAAYREAWPLDAGYVTRKTLYNLYHILNHLNLFGGGYLGQAQGMMERLLAEV
jgi:protein-ribulosamine 3-kinase